MSHLGNISVNSEDIKLTQEYQLPANIPAEYVDRMCLVEHLIIPKLKINIKMPHESKILTE